MNEIAKQRAIKYQDCREWSALDALEDAIEQIKKGEVNPEQLIIHILEKEDAEGRRKHLFQAAGVTYTSHVALLNIALRRIMDDWMD